MHQAPGATPGFRRRDFLTAAASVALGGNRAMAQTASPWAERPAGSVDKLNFVVWTYGDIYTKISAKFKTDWGVPIESGLASG